MAGRKLKPGVHSVVIRGKTRRVRVLANGRWQFLKGSSPRSGARQARRASGRKSRSRRSGVRRRGIAMARRKGGRARRYYRKARRAVSRFGMPSIFGLAAGLFAAAQMGVFDAAKRAMSGDLSGAGAVLASKATFGNMITAAIPAVGVVVARKFIGTVPVVRAGKFNVRLL